MLEIPLIDCSHDFLDKEDELLFATSTVEGLGPQV